MAPLVVVSLVASTKVPMVELSIKVSYESHFEFKLEEVMVDKLGLNWLNWLDWLREADMTPSMFEVMIRG